jgi:hypothetical protein
MTRPRLQLQLHLSTLLIVTVLAAGLVWLNVRERLSGIRDLTESIVAFYAEGRTEPVECPGRGWPMIFQYWYINGSSLDPARDPVVLAYNIVICLALLAVAAAAIEWATRRMKRKPAP